MSRTGTRELAALYDAHGGWMYRHALGIMASHAGAEDAVQQVFVKLASTDLAKVRQIAAYLRTALRGECYRLLERDKRQREVAGAQRPLLESVSEGGPEQDEQSRQLEAALRQLPAQQREVVYLKIYEGQTFQQIAATLEIPLNTAASRYRYALSKLQSLLAEVEP